MQSGDGKRSDFLVWADVRRMFGPSWTRDRIRRRILEGKIPCVRRGTRNVFPRAATERAIAALKQEEDGEKVDEAARDAMAVKMLAEGRTVGEVIVELTMKLERVERLQRALHGDAEPTPATTAPSSSTVRAAAPSSGDYFDRLMKESKRRYAAMKRGPER